MSRIQCLKTHSSHQEPGKSQLDWKGQLTNANTKMEQRLELSNNNFKVVIIKILQQAITNALETNENRKPSQSNRR